MSRDGAPMPLRAVAAVARRTAAAVSAEPPAEPRSYLCGACGLVDVGPRPAVCRGCARRESAIAVEDARADRLLIPPRFRWARLDLPRFAPEGFARWCAHPEAVRLVRASTADVLVLRGESGAGKTALACGKLFAHGAEGHSGAFVPCEALAGSADDQERAVQLYRLALTSRCVVLDDLGKELGGAPPGSPMAAFRGERVVRLIRELHDRSGVGTARRKLIVTLWQDDDTIAKEHGGDVWRRLLEEGGQGLELIELGKLGGRR